MNKKSLIILLNWNGGELTADCCKSLLEVDISSVTMDVLIIDNFSRADDYNLLKDKLRSSALNEKNFDRQDSIDRHLNEYHVESINQYSFDNGINILLVRSLINHGFARGCNLGAVLAKLMNYSHIVFLNNDTTVESDFLEKLFNYDSQADVIIPQIRYFEPSNVIWNCGGVLSKFGRREYFFANKDANKITLPNAPFAISFATGCCMLMKTSFYTKTGMFTEDFFFGEEDIDFSLRLQKMESKIICVPQSIIYHKVGSSLAGNIVKLRRKAHIHYLNRFINMKNHLGLVWGLWLIPSIFKMAVNMKSVYKLSVYENISFCFKVFIASLSKNKVEKDYFEKIMNNGY